MVLMKKLLKKNQIMITALAIMIAVAGYLNFAGAKIGEEDFLSTNGSDSELTYDVADISMKICMRYPYRRNQMVL